jgi:3-dehydroquinate dehydratase-2
MTATRILVLNGPNLNLLGTREPSVYGTLTLDELTAQLSLVADRLAVEVEFYQSNGEGALIDKLHASRTTHHGVVFNPGGYTHTSVALHDALRAIGLPCVEVHLTNTSAREEFRQKSITGAACVGRIEGFGFDSYRMGLEQIARIVRSK